MIPNAISPDRSTGGRPGRFSDGKWNLLFVGRMDEPRKGFRYLLEAFAMLERRWPGRYRLIAVGRGTGKWQRRAGGGEICWAGRVSRKELDRLYRSSDLVCAPSVGGESFGVILLEAFSFGKPVAGFRNRGYAGVMKEGETGHLVPVKQSRALAGAIAAIYADPSGYRKMCRTARDHVRQYHWPVVTRQYKRLYRALALR